jgi:hypothetical protein
MPATDTRSKGCGRPGCAAARSPASDLGFTALPASFLAALVVMILVYLVLIELGKRRFYHAVPHGPRSRADDLTQGRTHVPPRPGLRAGGPDRNPSAMHGRDIPGVDALQVDGA